MAAQDLKEPAARTLLLREGELLGGRYKIERWLGGGGMASVYRALHTGLGQPVAVKVVSPLVRELPGVVPRFMREARAATRLKSEHVVRVFDVGISEGGSPYFVMEMLEGKDLAGMLEEGFQPTVEEAIDCTLQACEALAEVHGLGIVHRDLKPANIFITRGPDGLACVKLIDFGISRVDSPLSPEDTVALTNPEVVMGSPRYMPPEQMESASTADARSDIWGLGAILYELLTGTAPFAGDSLLDIYAAAMRAPPPAPSTCRRGIPTQLDDVVLKCLRIDPADRHGDVAELAAALAPFGDDNAAARADAIARVLEASRARGNGGAFAIGTRDASRLPSSSRIRRRESAPPPRPTTRKRIGRFGAATALLVGLGVIGLVVAWGLDLVPDVDVSGAAAATAMPAAATAMPISAAATTTSTTAATAPEIAANALHLRAATISPAPTSSMDNPRDAAKPAPTPITPAPTASTFTPSARDLAGAKPTPKQSAPPPRPSRRQAAPRRDDRDLFEEPQ